MTGSSVAVKPRRRRSQSAVGKKKGNRLQARGTQRAKRETGNGEGIRELRETETEKSEKSVAVEMPLCHLLSSIRTSIRIMLSARTKLGRSWWNHDTEPTAGGTGRHLGVTDRQVCLLLVQYQPGKTIAELATAGRFRNTQISVTTAKNSLPRAEQQDTLYY